MLIVLSLSLTQTHTYLHTLAEMNDHKGVRFLKSRLEASGARLCLFSFLAAFIIYPSLLQEAVVRGVGSGSLNFNDRRFDPFCSQTCCEDAFSSSVLLHLSIFNIILDFAFLNCAVTFQ